MEWPVSALILHPLFLHLSSRPSQASCPGQAHPAWCGEVPGIACWKLTKTAQNLAHWRSAPYANKWRDNIGPMAVQGGSAGFPLGTGAFGAFAG